MSDMEEGMNVRAFDPDNPPDVPEGISRTSMETLPFSIALSDARLDDNPLIYVNSAFERMTGYSSAAAIGRNCRFLQGEETSPEAREKLRAAIEAKSDVAVDIINYRADGTRFLNRLLLSPLKGSDGTVTHFLGIQSPQPETFDFEGEARALDESLREVQHRVKNHLAMLLALIRMEAKRATDPQASLGVLANRVEALNLLYDSFSKGAGATKSKIALGSYVSRVCSALNLLDGQREVRINIDTESFDASIDAASHVGLLLSELLTNAMQHAFDEGQEGEIKVRLWDHEEDVLCLEVCDDGKGLPEGSNWPQEGNLGARIVRDLAKRLGADLNVKSSSDGTTVYLAIPKTKLRVLD